MNYKVGEIYQRESNPKDTIIILRVEESRAVTYIKVLNNVESEYCRTYEWGDRFLQSMAYTKNITPSLLKELL